MRKKTCVSVRLNVRSERKESKNSTGCLRTQYSESMFRESYGPEVGGLAWMLLKRKTLELYCIKTVFFFKLVEKALAHQEACPSPTDGVTKLELGRGQLCSIATKPSKTRSHELEWHPECNP